ATEREVPDLTVAGVFEEHVRRSPDAVAVVFGGERVTYAELDARANRLARHLLTRGAGRGDVVGVLLERGVELAVAVLAAAKAGTPYLLLDPTFPDERLCALAENAGVRYVIGRAEHKGRVAAPHPPVLMDSDAEAIASCSAEDPRVPVDPEDVFCVMFTSGSTGRPKGVLTPHRAVVGTFWGQDFADLGPDQVWLQCAPVSWDGFVLEFWGALLSGASCVLQPGQTPEPGRMASLVCGEGVTTLWLSAGLLNLMLDEYPQAFARVRQVMTGGEAPSAEHLRRFRETFPDVRLVHGYGPAEAVVFTNAVTLTAVPEGRIPVGGPLANKRVYVLDERLRQVPVGVTGEVYVAGVGLAHGYLGQPVATAERFLPDPFGGAGGRMYRTGDLGRWTGEGELVVVGRADAQVKIRGFRIEPGEVENAITALPRIAAAAVVAHGGTTGERRLVAYVVPETGVSPEPALVRTAAARVLPEYMVPSAVVVLDRLPLTPNGKVDRRALPEPDFGELSSGRAPRDAREDALCGLFAEVLGLGSVTIDDSFFDLGGHSLLAARLISRIRAVFGTEVGLREVFARPTVADLGELLVEGARTECPELVAVERPERVPLSFAQRRLWFLDRLEGPDATYNIPFSLRVGGEVDPVALEAALGDVVERHEALRTLFREAGGEPYQHVLDPDQARAALSFDRAADPEEPLSALAGYRFDLSEDLPLRGRLVCEGAGEWSLHLVLHHIAGDGASMPPLLRDLDTAYRARLLGRVPDWEPLEVQYADYTLWQREVLGAPEDASSVLARQTEYWRSALEGVPEELALPFDRPRPATTSRHGGMVPLALPVGLGEVLERVARENRCTLHMVLQAAVAAALSRLGTGSDIPLGTPVAGRGRAGLDALVGFFVNTLVARVDTSGGPTLRELLGRVRERFLADLEHQDVPFDHVVEVLNPVRSAGRNPLFQVMLTLEHDTLDGVSLAGNAAALVTDPSAGAAKFDLTAAFETGPGGLRGRLGYASDLFDEGTARRIGDVLVRVLEQIAEDTDTALYQVEILSPQEREQVVEVWNDTGAVLPELTVAGVFEEHVRRAPDAVAVVFGEERVTYAELDARANRLARYLGVCGAGRGDVVGVLLERGVELAVAVLAAAKAGTPYLLLDPTFPDDRLRSLAGDAGVRAVLTRGEWAERVPAPQRPVCVDTDAEAIACLPATLPETGVDPEDVFCVMFTSGSSGRPKGVLTPHRAVVGTFWGQDFADLGSDQVWLQCAPVSWDGFVLEFWGALLSGASCVLQPGQAPEPELIESLAREHGVTTLWLSAGLFNLMVDEYPGAFAGVRQVMTGGEAPSVEHLRRFRETFPHVRLVHGYGPAEAVVFTNAVTVGEVPEGRVPVGGPLANKRVYVLDGRLQPVPVGVTGEVYVAGVGLAHGYLGQPVATAERFLPDPFGGAGGRMYRTGDLGRWTGDGELVVVGRADAQVKIRGFRVEPGEVENALVGRQGVEHAAVIVHGGTTGERRLVAYVVPASGASIEPGQVRLSAAEVLPEYMVPSAVVVLDRLPLTPNGKVDRRALPEPDFGELSSGRAPRDAREEILCGLFAEVLGLGSVTIDDSFFDLGGHSLLAARLISRIRAAFGAEVGLRELFARPTVAGLAPKLVGAAGGSPGRSEPRRMERPERVPLSFAQRRLWFLDRLEGPSATYNIPVVLRLSGGLDAAALEAALGDVVERHEALRTLFREADGEPYQHVLDPDQARAALVLERADVKAEPSSPGLAGYRFDLSEDLPLRARLVDGGSAGGSLHLVLHHIAGDGASMGPLLEDLARAYRDRAVGERSDSAPLPVQYADYTLWQREVLGAPEDASSVLAGQTEYWRSVLEGVPEELA
ncbi:non-ribosomal peptide synthetase, partial [Nocardiopsis sp. FR6]|uniref:non-ribosomal peptide synthetase n=1 Tax=Nocardiopsis sp. FR6 TaxID=2605986 RepID=UPI001359613F